MANYIEQILELEAQQKSIEEQKKKILAQAKSQAMQAAEKAVADLNNLGFSYKLVDGGSTTRAATSTRTRKSGVADEVHAIIKSAQEGLTRSGVLAAMNAMDAKAQQSISNALSNLKKKGQVSAENGVYKAV